MPYKIVAPKIFHPSEQFTVAVLAAQLGIIETQYYLNEKKLHDCSRVKLMEMGFELDMDYAITPSDQPGILVVTQYRLFTLK